MRRLHPTIEPADLVEATAVRFESPDRSFGAGCRATGRVSPYFRADRVVRPLLMYYGANDPRFNISEIEEFVTTVRGNGVAVEYLLFEDEGHFLVSRANRIALQETWLRFLETHLR